MEETQTEEGPLHCSECGETFKRAAIMALLIDLGAKTRDPNECWATEDGEHNWTTDSENDS